jgi:hypothetical protein
MSYKNVLGKDFDTKPEAYKHLRDKINEFIVPYSTNYIVMTEKTPIKQSEMIQLSKDYGSHTQEWETRKSHAAGIDQWCVMRNFVKKTESISLGFLRNRKEGESRLDAVLPEAVTAKKIFTCFGKGEFNQNEILNSALRNEVEDQIENFRKSLKDSNICACCGKRFPPQEMVVDHIFEFKYIVKEFFETKGWKEFMMKSLYKEADGVLYRIQDISPDDEFYPDSPRQEWQEFHKKKATLQMLRKGCHDSKTYAKKIKFKTLSGNESPKM